MLCGTSGVNLIVCDYHIMKQIIKRFIKWREDVLSKQTEVASNSMLLPYEMQVSEQKPNPPRVNNMRQ